jgi:hypothetical protein
MRRWIVAGLVILVGISLAVNLTREHPMVKEEANELAGDRAAPATRPVPGQPSSLLDDFQIRSLQKMGLSDPLRQIPADLMAHSELIPVKGVHGGTMGFYSTEGITILSPSWVFARFEDGHMMGTCLLEYAISPDTTIHWKLIKAQMDE